MTLSSLRCYRSSDDCSLARIVNIIVRSNLILSTPWYSKQTDSAPPKYLYWNIWDKIRSLHISRGEANTLLWADSTQQKCKRKYWKNKLHWLNCLLPNIFFLLLTNKAVSGHYNYTIHWPGITLQEATHWSFISCLFLCWESDYTRDGGGRRGRAFHNWRFIF